MLNSYSGAAVERSLPLRGHKAVTLNDTLLLQTEILREYGKSQDATECQKLTIVVSRAQGHTVSGVAEFVGVSERTVQRVYKQ